MRVGVFASFYGYHPYPTGWPRWHIMPILAGHHTGITTSTSGLIKVKS
jgi:hypothetical protein